MSRKKTLRNTTTHFTSRMRRIVCGFLAWVTLMPAGFVLGEQLIPLRNGVTLRGIYIEIPTLNENSFSLGSDGGIQTRPIWMVDDGLRRTYIHRRGMVNAEPVQVPDLGLRLEFPQPVPDGGDEVGAIGQILGMTPLNSYGRRQLIVRGTDGRPTPLHQGITELTARYAKLDGLKSERSIRLDMRVATETIDTASLRRIFRRRLDQNDPGERLDAVRFFAEAERYGDAQLELRQILDQFPDQQDLKPQITALVERQAMQLIDQAKLRADSGQPALAATILKQFPVQRVSAVTRLRVQDELGKLQRSETQRTETVQRLRTLAQQLTEPEQAAVAGLIDEIDRELSANTLPRMSDFIRLGGNDAIPIQQRVALAVAGWILGSGSGEQNFKLATSLIQVRDLVAEYLATPDPIGREAILTRLIVLEAARAETIAKLLPLLPPVLASEAAMRIQLKPESAPEKMPSGTGYVPIDAVADEGIEGMFHVGPGEDEWMRLQTENPQSVPPASYLVQLPPEYDPLRSYPCVIAIHAPGAAAQTQLNWWAGVPTERFLRGDAGGDDDASGQEGAPAGAEAQPAAAEAQPVVAGAQEGPELDKPQVGPAGKSMRLGHAMRHGFIVVTPRWTRPGQSTYEYTMREHDAVLRCVRGAMRRFSIDSDRVFIGGHGPGGAAAWDIAFSHPDLWSGMVAISSEPEKTLIHYDPNSVHVPIYIVMGEKDGRPLKRNGAVYDDYMTYQHDAMVVMYRGRGKEFFYEESGRIFDWMKTAEHRRAKMPATLELVSMRYGDRFFWWLEWDDPLPNTVLDPILWDESPRLKAAKVSAVIGANNEVRIGQGPANAFTVWLTPEMPLNFAEPIVVKYRSRRVDFRFDGEFKTMLEDVRTRADRKRPFWGRVTIP